MTAGKCQFVSRAGLKLEHAVREFELDVNGMLFADFGVNVGGFTDCLLQRGAAKIYALDTGYGVVHWRLRQDPRVVVMERTNALHALPPEPVDLIVIDLAWTRQRLALPAARQWLRHGGVVLTLVKPHYELEEHEKRELLVHGRLDPSEANRICERVMSSMPKLGITPVRWTQSPLTGGKSSRHGTGNIEFVVQGAVDGDAPT